MNGKIGGTTSVLMILLSGGAHAGGDVARGEVRFRNVSALSEIERGGLAELWRWPRIIDALLDAVAPDCDCSSRHRSGQIGEVSDAQRRRSR